MTNFFAHTAPDGKSWELLKTHLLNVANRARLFASAFDAGEEGYTAGLLHDLGKYGELFQKRLQGIGQHVDHWTAGAWAAMKYLRKCSAIAIQGHHIGLQATNAAAFKKIRYGFPTEGTQLSETPFAPLLTRFNDDELSLPNQFEPFYFNTKKYCSDMLDVRMLFSSLADADYLETEKFMNSVENHPQRPISPKLDAPRAFIALIKHIESINKNKKLRNDIAAMRATLLNACLSAAKTRQTAFTLSAPTGSGKTLAMLAFALQHAIEHPMISRIIVVLPFLNVIEQTAQVYRTVFKDSPPGYIVEHHSLAGTYPRATNENDDEEDNAAHRERLAAENWDAPIIITTNVQFLESLFANRPSACRKLHNIVGSIVLFDEIQTLPPELAIHTLAALSRLIERYKTTVVFATATQPAFSSLHQETLNWCTQGWAPVPMLPHATERQLFGSSRRVCYRWPVEKERLSWDAVAEKMRTETKKQALCVVNTKKQALELTNCLRKKMTPEERTSVFHFSTNMCPQHRRDKLAEIKARLDAHQPCFLVATQCIEAGVDISFPVVLRAWAPLEAIIQTAGRCNRNNELYPEKGICYVFQPLEEKFPMGFYGSVTAIARAYMGTLDSQTKEFLDDPSIIEKYYATVYTMLKQSTSSSKYKELSDALQCADFPTVATKYRLINQDTINVVVPYKKGNQLTNDVLKTGLTAEWTRRVQVYSVAVRRPRQDDLLRDIMEPAPILRRGERLESEDWFLCTTNAKYDELTGLEVPHGNDFCGA